MTTPDQPSAEAIELTAVFYALAARLTRTPPLALIGLGLAAAVWVPGFTLVYVLAAQQLTCPPENHGCLF